MYEIGKTFTFAAKHHLPQAEEGHKCREEHGHNYKVTLVMQSEFLTAEGWVWDYGAMSAFKDYVNTTFDHHNVNDTVYLGTAEAIAAHLYERAFVLYGPYVVEVAVKETEGTYATYRQ